ncbi:DeoR/GlpR family DNA-binding transcription regulator [Fonticella tunisiensis]|uniref:Lactose phosphotransferase system repressor n=1 Tax=Fonticella tunisiensis TaxID=1096341 RepID=A0A4R7KTS1_9CLOT|nr:DeoR/GlpR family DNA-binding transcription regulator [Fonticella tunisiensis]TDT62448.1 DeoR family transcriptional regulator [Fonticella tunisiensis]
MFASERLEEIVKILNREGKVVVKELSQLFNVTEDCIRKDLKNLENQKLIKRTYGGAVLLRSTAREEKIENRKERDLEAKRIIAEKAFGLIEENETIFLDISTINILLSEIIAKSSKRLTVITNMLDIVKSFSNNNTCKVICTGGVFNKELDGFIGAAAIESISKYKVSKAFIGSCGIDIYDGSITTFDVEDGNTKKAIMQSSRKVFLVMENKKFYIDGTYKFAHLQDVNSVITEERPNDNLLEILASNDTSVI